LCTLLRTHGCNYVKKIKLLIISTASGFISNEYFQAEGFGSVIFVCFSVHLESVILFKDAWTENQIIG
jgi:hypothetical protein